VLPLGGWFFALIGRKRSYMICVARLYIGFVAVGVCPQSRQADFLPVLQELAGGALQSISQAILVASFPRNKQGMAMAVYGMGVVLAPVLGPTLGGWITDSHSWLDLSD
jgi:DHA2 family multidrug resistance protein